MFLLFFDKFRNYFFMIFYVFLFVWKLMILAYALCMHAGCPKRESSCNRCCWQKKPRCASRAPSLEHHPWSSGEEDQGLQVDQDQDLDQDQENKIRRTQSRSGSYFLGLHCIKYFQNVFRAEIHLNEVRYGQQWSIQSRLEMASRDPFKCG